MLKSYFMFIFVLLYSTSNGLPSPVYAAQPVKYAVLYPQVRDEYAQIFLDIIHGIQQTAGTPPAYIQQLARNSHPKQLEKAFKNNNIEMVVALGSRSYQFSTQFENPPPILVAATQETIHHFSSLNLTPQPQLMFDKLSQLAPNIKKVTIIYNPEHNQWMMKQAILAAKQYNLTLQLIKVSSLKAATEKYRYFFNHVDPETEALFLPLDSTVINEKITIPFILTSAWKQQVVVFSCNPIHVKRGVLFSIYPDSQRIGQDIGDLIKIESTSSQHQIHPMRRSIFSLNKKTALHLNLNIPDTLEKELELHADLLP